MTVPRHGGQVRELAARYGLRADDILDFSANINPDGPPASVLAALHGAIDEPGFLTTYPELDLHTLCGVIGTHLEVAPECVSVANGFVPLLESTLRARRTTRCLLAVPAFNEYRATLERCGVEVVPLPLEAPDYRYPLEAMEQATAHGCDAVLLANPQNPTGVLTEAARLAELCKRMPTCSILLDEAFIDFAPEETLCRAAAESANLVVFRSVTKFFAIPGLRIAYAVAGEETAVQISRQLAPWPVSKIAERAVAACLRDGSFARQTLESNVRRREQMRAALADLPLEIAPAAANFLLLRFEQPAELVWERLLREHRVLLRRCENFEGLGPNFLRVCVRDEADNARLVRALRASMD